MKTFLDSVDKQSLEEIKVCLKQIEKDIKKKRGAYSQFTNLKHLINTIKDGNGRGCLHFAASRGDIPIFEYLLSLEADNTLQDNEKNTPFFISAQHGHLPMLKYIVEKLN